ncbi:hypothetical protein SLEP1_g8077 [Rubroshorea leprosula]|uniref:Reverse transcriptase Ty1/copia-type domain-containing protein n=1 Tax=Rubroshorea leprosula TaxID=152421 RepID=A0AAV5I0H9_9ROSI|nr:hypothetical protein SLEP1_g8077 [Rubroshorea leprosula]
MVSSSNSTPVSGETTPNFAATLLTPSNRGPISFNAGAFPLKLTPNNYPSCGLPSLSNIGDRVAVGTYFCILGTSNQLVLQTPSPSPNSPSPHTPPSLSSSSPLAHSSSSSPPSPPLAPPLAPPQPLRTHSMVTRAQNNIFKLKQLFHTIPTPVTTSLEPTCVSQALKEPIWRQAMFEEFTALVWQGTWELVPLNASQHLIGCKWDFRVKRDKDGSIECYKARLVAKGNNSNLIRSLVQKMEQCFSLKDLGPLTFFLGIEAIPTSTGLLLSQHKNILDILRRANMDVVKLVSMPLPSSAHLSSSAGLALFDSSDYCHILGSLRYLTLTRLDISFVVNRLS